MEASFPPRSFQLHPVHNPPPQLSSVGHMYLQSHPTSVSTACSKPLHPDAALIWSTALLLIRLVQAAAQGRVQVACKRFKRNGCMRLDKAVSASGDSAENGINIFQMSDVTQ